jgi:hypothetical protein
MLMMPTTIIIRTPLAKMTSPIGCCVIQSSAVSSIFADPA